MFTNFSKDDGKGHDQDQDLGPRAWMSPGMAYENGLTSAEEYNEETDKADAKTSKVGDDDVAFWHM